MIPIASSFRTALEQLNTEKKGHVFTFLLKFHEDNAHPSISLERVQHAKCPDLWSGRVNKEMRAILHKDGKDWIAVYVGAHDAAYHWAEKYLPGRHPVTGVWQIVEMPLVPSEPKVAPPTVPAGLFAQQTDAYLLSLGVPELWLPALRLIKTHDELLEAIEKLPSDVGERLWDVADGKLVLPPPPLPANAPLSESEAVTQNLTFVRSKDELRFLLDAPMAKWIAFLHPSQKKLVQGDFKGAVKVTGSAGTGKTVVAMHRAKQLAAQGQRVLVTSYVQTLCRNIERNLQLFCTPAELDRITVVHVHKLAADLLKGAGQTWQPLDDKEIARLLEPLYPGRTCPLDMEQLLAEWQAVVEAQGLTTWEQYRSASRAGRGRALTIKDRKAVWEVLGKLHDRLEQQHAATYAGLCRRAAALFQSGQHASPFDAVIVDELQDLKAQELLFLAQLAPNQNLMLVGDAGQRIYSGKVTLKTLGIDVRGRSYVLRINYRTTEQIRRFADQLLEAEADDLDGGRETRNETRSLLSGPQPILQSFANRQAQNDFVCAKIQEFLAQGRTPDEIGVFARQTKLLEMLETRLKRAGIPLYRLSKEEFPHAPAVNLGTMHRAKGLEFKIVFVLDVADEYLPTASVLQNKKDEQLREEFIELERQLLYVSVTRARDAVFLTWAGTPSRFLKQAE